jgi:DHA1 family bicyclomycin/chloramphenicol resistance-like MFS transporter
MLGFIQLGIGALISSGISFGKTSGNLPIIAILAVTSLLGGVVLMAGRRRAQVAIAQAPAQNL